MKNLLSVVITAVFTASAISCPIPESFKLSENMPPFTPQDLSDSIMPSGWSIANLWALWCAPCRKELPMLEKFAAAQTQIPIIAVNLDDGKDAAAEFFNRLGIKSLKPISTADSELPARLGIAGLPYTAVLFNGRVQLEKNGLLQENDFEQIRAFINCKQQEHKP